MPKVHVGTGNPYRGDKMWREIHSRVLHRYRCSYLCRYLRHHSDVIRRRSAVARVYFHVVTRPPTSHTTAYVPGCMGNGKYDHKTAKRFISLLTDRGNDPAYHTDCVYASVTLVYCGWTPERIKLLFVMRLTTQISYFVSTNAKGNVPRGGLMDFDNCSVVATPRSAI